MSSNIEVVRLYDSRLDPCSNEALNGARRIRANYTPSPERINPKILYLGLIELPRFKRLAVQHKIGPLNHPRIELFASSKGLVDFLDNLDYQNDLWQSNHWDQNVDKAIADAYQTSLQKGLSTTPSGVLLWEVVRSQPIQDILFGDSRNEQLQRFTEIAKSNDLNGTNSHLGEAV